MFSPSVAVYDSNNALLFILKWKNKENCQKRNFEKGFTALPFVTAGALAIFFLIKASERGRKKIYAHGVFEQKKKTSTKNTMGIYINSTQLTITIIIG